MNKDDRRVRKTKKALADGLIFLLSQKDLRSITIKELTDTADVHRATFYVHYKDVYDLYEQLENNVVNEFRQIISSSHSHTYEGVFKLLVDFIYDNAQLCKMFFPSISHVVEECYLEVWVYEDNKSAITDEMRYLAAYNVQGCNAIIDRWMADDFSCPKKDIIALLKLVNDNFNNI